MFSTRIIYLICIAILVVSLVGGVWYGWHIIRTETEIERLQHARDTVHMERDDWHMRSDEDSNGVATSSEQIDSPTVFIPDTIVADAATTEERPIPQQVHLIVPFTSQAPERNWEQPWQDACEEAAILMLDAYYKGYNLSPLFARDELLKMVAWQQEQEWGGSIPIAQVRDTAGWFMNRNTQQFQILEYPSLSDIKAQLAAGHPVLAVGDGTVLNNPYFSGDGPPYHAFLIIGYDDRTGEFITNDPGTQHGKDFRYPYENVMTALADWNKGDVSNGIPVVLVKQ